MKVKSLKVVLIVLTIVILLLGLKFLITRIYPFKYSEYIMKYSEQYKLDPYFVAAVIKTESNFNVDARSNKGATGLMQITEDTSVWIAEQLKMENFQLTQLRNPETNIRMGCWYLNNLNQEFQGDSELVLAAYNAGRGNVNNWLQSGEYSKDGKKLHYVPYKETDKYIKRVKVNFNIYKLIYKKK